MRKLYASGAFPAFLCLIFTSSVSFGQTTSLRQKADLFDQILQTQHVREGLVIPTVIQVIEGNRAYTNTTLEDACISTGEYVLTESMRYATTHEQDAKEFAQASMRALLKLEAVTGVPGVVARCYVRTDTPKIDEQAFFFAHEWHKSSAMPGYRWLGDLSVDQLDGWLVGLATYYDLVADESEKRDIAAAVDRVAQRLVDNDLRIVDVDGKMTLWGNMSPSLPHEHLNALLALSSMKIAHHVTGKGLYAKVYSDLIEKHHFHEEAALAKVLYPRFAVNHSDDNLAALALYALMKYEKDPWIRWHYRVSVERHWLMLRDENHAFYDFWHQALVPDAQSFDEHTLDDLKKATIRRSKHTAYMRTQQGPVKITGWWQHAPGDFLRAYWFGRYHGFLNANGELKSLPPPPEMVLVPAGEFIMGSNTGDADETPQRKVYLPAFYIDRCEVTNAQFKKFDPSFNYPKGKDNYPALVTWEQANAYAKWAGKRLPTEAEWEKAARGTDGRLFPWGNFWDLSLTVWDTNSPVGTNPAGASPYGTLDMAGNVWEWTADWYKPYPGNKVPSPAYGEKYKVIRGGSEFNDVSFFRCSHRYYVPPNSRIHGYAIGFRCVKEAE